MTRITREDLLVIVNLTDIEEPTWPQRESTPLLYDLTFNHTEGPPAQALTCNSSTNGLSELNFYLNGVSTMAIIALGVIGNSLAIIVLTRRTMHTSTNTFLTALAIWDTVVLLVGLLLISLIELFRPFRERVFPYVVVYAYPVALAAQTATVWLTVSFTVERYIAVCHPLRSASMCTITRARFVVLCISAVSVLYNIPRWFEYIVVKLTDVHHQVCIFPERTPLANDSIYHRIYFGWLYFLVMCFIPLCSLAVLNLFLIVAVRRSRQQRKDMNVRQSRENNVTIMLVSVVMVFIICQVPALIYNMAYAIDMQKVSTSAGWIVVSNTRNFLVTLNSAINFILYCALGQKFRRTFVRTLCPCLLRQVPGIFQSFSFSTHKHTINNKSIVNGNTYASVGYKQCRTEIIHRDQDVSLDMKVLRPKHSPGHSTDSNGSTETNEAYHSNLSQRSHLKLLTPAYKNKST